METPDSTTERQYKNTGSRPTQAEQGAIGIKLKLLGVLLPIVIAVILAVVLLVYLSTKDMMLQKSEELLNVNTESVINDIRAWMNETLTALDVERDAVQYFDMEEEEELDYIKHTADTYAAFPAGLYLATTEGKLIHASFIPGPDYNIFEKPWYQEGIDSEEFRFGAVYFDEDSQAYVVGASGVWKDAKGTVRGVAAADIYLDAISEIVGKVQLEESGGMMLIDTLTGTIIGHKDSALLGTNLEEQQGEMYSYLKEKLQADSLGISTFQNTAGDKYYLELKEVPGCSWVSVAYVPYNEILAELSQLTRYVVFLAAAGLILLVILMERFIHIIVKPVKRLSRTIASMTDGDFSVEVNVKTRDEIGKMANGVGRFIHTMRDIIYQIGLVSADLNSQSLEGAKIAENLSQSADVQSSSMAEMTHTVNDLAQSIMEVAENASRLSGLVDETRQSGQEAGSQMQEAVKASASGKEDMAYVTESMHLISDRMDSLEQSAERMDESISKINSIVGLIRDIAEETNLLSLNASIEAARAGEAGRGFAVVADQIGKLANTSKEAVNDIASLTDEISTMVTQTVTETRDSAGAIRSSSDAVNQAQSAFQQIYQTVERTNAAVIGMIEMVQEVNEIATGVAGITQQQSAASEEILATTETINRNAKEVFRDSQVMENDAGNLEKNAEKLSSYMEKFKL